MKILIAPDKFKGTLSAAEVASTVAMSLQKLGIAPTDINSIPMADGGEGSLNAIAGTTGEVASLTAFDALMRPIEMPYAILPDGTAVVEAAACIGLSMLRIEERNPMATTSFGLGRAISQLIAKGSRRFIVALGGSATDDGGAGMAAALGARFYDADDKLIEIPTGASLASLKSIDFAPMIATVEGCRFTALCDVRNPLLGPDGATMVYARQKGAADNYTVRRLEKGKCRLQVLAAQSFKGSFASAPFAGAAGGLGWAMMAFFGAEACSGSEYIARESGLESAVEAADLVISGEGRIDAQTAEGKTVDYVAALARRYQKPLVLLCGRRAVAMSDCFSLYEWFGRDNDLRRTRELLGRMAYEVLPRYVK